MRLPFDGAFPIPAGGEFGAAPYPIAIKNPDGTDFSSQYNDGQYHHAGVDWAMRVGIPILATESGTVTLSGDNGTAGKEVRVQGATGIWRYLHNSELKVGIGAQVGEGQPIALSGNTGYTTGPHLHLYLSRGGKYVDPVKYLGNSGGSMSPEDQAKLQEAYGPIPHAEKVAVFKDLGIENPEQHPLFSAGQVPPSATSPGSAPNERYALARWSQAYTKKIILPQVGKDYEELSFKVYRKKT